jgi:hypothetical protein
MEMKDIKDGIDSLLSGVKLMIDKGIKDAGYDKTYIGYVIDKDDDNLGNKTTYRVMIQNQEYKNTPVARPTEDGNDGIQAGDSVYVLFPRNNPNNRVILN